MVKELSFENLAVNVSQIHELTSGKAKYAVNQMLTVRNWAIGYYIVEYEQNGKDRAEYGVHVLSNLANRLQIKGLDRTMLNLCRIFYLKYPQLCESVNHILHIDGYATAQLIISETYDTTAAIKASEICDSMNHIFQTDPEVLITRLSFTHIREIMRIDDPLERFFYEFECIKGVWSVRELKRQIASKLYFRTGISKKPELLFDHIQNNDPSMALSIKDPYTFEFLGLNDKLAVTESDLEDALLNHLQDFFLELGKGFCLEARQKRLLIDDEYYYPDLVFYNRYLRCNVIVDLKVHEFRYEDFGQLNAYVGYYKMNEMADGDNPPCGILLCTKKGPQMVEYVLSGMDNQLFVSTYMLQLPNKRQLEEFLEKEVQKLQR